MGGNRGNTDGSKSSLNTGKSERQVLYWQREVLNQDLVLQKYFWEIDKCVRLFTQFRRSITITCLIMLLCGVFSGGHFLIVPCVFLLLIFCCSYVLLILFVLSSCCFHFFFFSIFCWSWYSQLHWELTLSLHNSRKDYWKGLKAIKASAWQIYLSLRWKEEEKWRWRTRRLLRRRSRRVCRRRGWHPPAAVPRLARDGCLTFSSHPLFPSTGSSDSFSLPPNNIQLQSLLKLQQRRDSRTQRKRLNRGSKRNIMESAGRELVSQLSQSWSRGIPPCLSDGQLHLRSLFIRWARRDLLIYQMQASRDLKTSHRPPLQLRLLPKGHCHEKLKSRTVWIFP